jgi:hypothetical protein
MKLHKYPSDNNNFGSIWVNPLNLELIAKPKLTLELVL